MNLSFKLANNGKLTSDKHKKYLENNLCLYYNTKDYKLNSCLKKQTIVTSKSCDASTIANPPAATSKKLLKK